MGKTLSTTNRYLPSRVYILGAKQTCKGFSNGGPITIIERGSSSFINVEK